MRMIYLALVGLAIGCAAGFLVATVLLHIL